MTDSKPRAGRRPRDDSPALARNLRRLRLARDWTQRQLADESGVPLRSLVDYERGRMPYLDVASKIAQALGTTVDALLSEGIQG